MRRLAAHRITTRPINTDEWLSVVRASEQATFFHTPYWCQIGAASGPGFTDASVAIELSDGATAVYPLLRQTSDAGPVVFSSFAGCYGGPVAERSLTASEMIAMHAAVARLGLGYALVTLDPAALLPHAPSGFVVEDDFTHVIEIEGRDFDDVVKSFQRNRQQYYRRGLRGGLAVSADPEPSAAEYFSLYGRTLARWADQASSSYSASLFERLCELAQELPDTVKLWRAELQGELVGGMWVFYWNGHVVLWHISVPEFPAKTYSPTVSLCAEVIRDAIERGWRRVDLAPSGGHDAVVDFKRRLGAYQLPVQRLRTAPPGRRGPWRLARRIRRRAMAR